MVSTLEQEYIDQGYKVVTKGQGGTVVELPNSYQVTVPTVNDRDAFYSAGNYYENVQKKEGTKDKLAWRDMLPYDREFIGVAREYYRENDSAAPDEDWYNDPIALVDHFVSDMRWRDNNTVSLGKSIARNYGAADEQKKRFAYLLNTWDAMPAFHETGGSGILGLGSNVLKAVADPASLLGLGLLSIGKRFAIGAVGKVATKDLLKDTASQKVMTSALQKIPASMRAVGPAALTSGSLDMLISGGFAYGDAKERALANTALTGVEQKVDLPGVAKAAALGLFTGTALTGGIGMGINKFKTPRSELISSTRKGFLSFDSITNLAEKYLTTSGLLGEKGAQIVRTLGGKRLGLAVEVRAKAARTEAQVVEAFGETSYDGVKNNPQSINTLNIMFNIVGEAYSRRASLQRDLDYNSEDIPSSAPLSSGVYPMFGGIRTGARETLEKFEAKKYQGRIEDIDVDDLSVGGTIPSMDEVQFAAKMLDNNQPLKNSLEELAETQAKYRAEVGGSTQGDIFTKTKGLHQTTIYNAFIAPDKNLTRVKETKAGDGSTTIFDIGVNYLTDRGIGLETARDAISLMAQGQVAKAKETLTINYDTLSKELKDFLGPPNSDKFDVTVSDIVNTASIDDAALGASNRATKSAIEDKVVQAALKKRESIPKELRDILGFINNDPIKRGYEAEFRLGVLSKTIESNNDLFYTLIQTGQIKKLGMSDTEAPLKKEFDILQEQVTSGEIKNAQEFRMVIEKNSVLKEKAYQEMLLDTDVYNPIAIAQFSKGFKTEFDRALYGSNPLGEATGTGWFRTALTETAFLNTVASIGKTAFSTSTIGLNMIGGAMQGFVVLGVARPLKNKLMNALNNLDEPVSEEAFKFIYAPIWMDLIRGQINKESTGSIGARLYNKANTDGTKTYTKQQVDNAIKIYGELFEANILDNNMLQDTLSMLKYKSAVHAKLDTLYDGPEGVVGKTLVKPLKVFIEGGKRVYASGDEFFKVVYYMDRRNHYTRLGFSDEVSKLRAQKDVFRHLPNYRFQPGLFKTARLLGVGNFVSHTLEITRNTKNIIVDSLESIEEGRRFLKEGDRKKATAFIYDGTTKLARLSAVVGGAEFVAEKGYDIGSWAYENAFGRDVSANEKKALQTARNTFLPDWHQGSNLVPYEIDSDGNATLVNMTHMNPFGVVSVFTHGFSTIHLEADRLMQTGMSIDEAYSKGFAKAALKYLDPFVTKSLGTAPLLNALMRDPYKGEDRVTTFVQDTVNSFVPGFVGTIGKFYGDVEPKWYETGPNDAPLKGKELILSQSGVKFVTHNLSASVSNTFGNIRRKYKTAQSGVTSAIRRKGLKSTSDVVDIFEHLNDIGNNQLQKEVIRDERRVEDFVETFREAQAERFKEERELMGAFYSYATILRSLPKYRNDNDAIAKEIYRAATTTKAGVSKALAEKLTYAAAYQKAPPLYQPFLIPEATLLSVVSEAPKNEQERMFRMVRKLSNETLEVAKYFVNRPLNLRLQTNE